MVAAIVVGAVVAAVLAVGFYWFLRRSLDWEE